MLRARWSRAAVPLVVVLACAGDRPIAPAQPSATLLQDLEREQNVRYWELYLRDETLQKEFPPERLARLRNEPIQQVARDLGVEFFRRYRVTALDLMRASPEALRLRASQGADAARAAEVADTIEWYQQVVARHVEAVGRPVAEAAGRPALSIVVDPAVGANAVVPHGRDVNRLFFGPELALLARQDDEVACVVGHEIAHMTQGHSATGRALDLGKEAFAETAAVALAFGVHVASGGVLSDRVLDAAAGAGYVGGKLAADAPFLISGYERSQELEADAVGLGYARGAGFEPQACVRWWERLAPLERAQDDGVPGWWRTHPSSPERAAALRALVGEPTD